MLTVMVEQRDEEGLVVAITSAPTGLFGSHYAFSDTVPGKSLSSDVLFISVQTSMAGGPTPASLTRQWRKKGLRSRVCTRVLDLLYVRRVDPLHASNGLSHGGWWVSGCGIHDVFPFPTNLQHRLYDLSFLSLQGEWLRVKYGFVSVLGREAYYLWI